MIAPPEDAQPGVYTDAELYDWLAEYTAPNDLPFYRRLRESHPGPLLEIGCGTGRVCLPLAADGASVAGIDLSAALLQRAAAKARDQGLKADLQQADMRGFDLDRRFDLLLVPYNTFNHLYALNDLRAALTAWRQHMHADSRLVIDTFNPDLAALAADGSTENTLFRVPSPRPGTRLRLLEVASYDPSTQIYASRWRFCDDDGTVWREDRIRMRVFFPAEVQALLELQGLEMLARYGDYDGRPFGPGAAKQLLVCRRR